MRTSFEPGHVIDGRFRIERLLGRGGMGEVYRARDDKLHRTVAIKVLREERAASQAIVERFAREARTAARLTSENVVRILDIATTSFGAPYIVMECLEGRDLATEVRLKGPLNPSLAVEHVRSACLGLAEVHARGLVHRDIKPANLFLTQRADGTALIKVLDFGIARALDGLSERMTTATGLLGSPHYMSPEQMRSARDADSRSDVWSLGIVLHELISGSTPFAGESVPEICIAVLEGRRVPLTRLSPEIDASIERIVARCLELDPARRYADASALGRALDGEPEPLASLGAEAAPAPSDDGIATRTFVEGLSSVTASERGRTAPDRSSRRDSPARRSFGIAIVATASLVAIGGWTWRQSAQSEPTAAASIAAPSLEAPRKMLVEPPGSTLVPATVEDGGPAAAERSPRARESSEPARIVPPRAPRALASTTDPSRPAPEPSAASAGHDDTSILESGHY